MPRLSRAAVWRGVTTDYWRRFRWRNLVVHSGLPRGERGGVMRGWEGRQGASDAGLRDARADADRREATHRGAACCDGPKCSVRLRHVTLLGWPDKPEVLEVYPHKTSFRGWAYTFPEYKHPFRVGASAGGTRIPPSPILRGAGSLTPAARPPHLPSRAGRAATAAHTLRHSGDVFFRQFFAMGALFRETLAFRTSVSGQVHI